MCSKIVSSCLAYVFLYNAFIFFNFKGADLSAEDRQGQTSLSWACLKGRVAIAQYLLDRGAPINHADKSGKTSLDLATLNGNPALVQVS